MSFSYQIVGSNVKNVLIGTPNSWGVSKLRFIATSTTAKLIIRPGNNAAATANSVAQSMFFESVQISATVNAINSVPIAVNDNESVVGRNPVTLNVLTNDSDPGGSLNPNSVDLDPSTPGIQKTLNDAQGAWSVDALGNVTFTPAPYFSGTAIIPYTVEDNYSVPESTPVSAPATSSPAYISIFVSVDSDGDGITDDVDLDDDNDGILDAVESPSCFYTAGEANVIRSIKSGFNPSAGSDIPNLRDATTATVFIFASGQVVNPNDVLLAVEYITPVPLTSLSVDQLAQGLMENGSPSTPKYAKLYGSNNGFEFTALSLATAGVQVNTTGVKLFTNSTPAIAYKYYQIRYIGTTASGNLIAGNIGTGNIREVTTVFNAVAYKPSANQKLGVCAADTDGDGIPNHLDLDSDGDGCTDALEGGASFTINDLRDATGALATQTPNRNLGNTVNTTVGSTSYGVPQIAGTGQSVSYSQNSLMNECRDSDGDGIPDIIDLDDDNDGILDALESPSCYSCVLGTTNTWTSYQTSLPNNTVLPPAVDESATFGSQNPETIISTKFPHSDPFGFGMPWYNGMVLKSTNNVFGVIDELSNTQSHSEWHVNMAIWQPPVAMANQPLRIRTNDNGLYGSPGGGRTETSKLFAMVNDGTAPMLSADAGIDSNYNEVNLGNWNGTSCVILALYMFDQSLLHDNGVIEYWNGTSWVALPTNSVSAMPAKTVGCTNDTDGDGIPNHLDLDSDGDGCPDAIEGGATFTNADLVTVTIGALATQTPNQNLGNTVGDASTTMGVPTIAGVGQTIGNSQSFSRNDCLDSDGDGIPDWQDVDDDNDGILDTAECGNTFGDLLAASVGNRLSNILPSDFGLSLNTRRQNISRDISAKFGYPANSGAVIISITNASVHPTIDAWWTKIGEPQSVWRVTGTMSAFVIMSQNDEYYGNDSKTIHIYDGDTVIPIAGTGDPDIDNQQAIGQWSIRNTPTEKTLINLDTNTANIEYGNWRFANMNFGPKTFGFSTTTAFADPTYAVNMYLECDSDLDGIPDRLDLDSDGDGCSDALEGGAVIATSQLQTAGGTLSGGSTNVNQNICTTCVSTGGANIGLPQFATPIPSGYSNATGQSIGDSQNGAVGSCFCTQLPASGAGEITRVGISVQQKQEGWPENIPNGHIVLESKEKGLVITRVDHVSFVPQATDSIATPFAGMLVYDIEDSCVKLFNGINWKCLERSCNTSSN